MLGVILLLGCIACDKSDSEFKDEQLYMHFQSDILQTRAVQKNSFENGNPLGIIGYLYVREGNNIHSGTSDWATKRSLIMPEPDLAHLEATYRNGSLDYGVTKRWSSVSEDKYTFFAYYPRKEEGVKLSEKKLGAPSLIYTLPYTDTGFSDIEDVMVASRIDHQKKNGAVRFTFDHILSCVDFAIHNLNNNTTIRITSLSLQGTFYNKTEVNMETLEQVYQSHAKYDFNLVNSNFDVPSTLNTASVSVGEKQNNYLLIVPLKSPTDWEVKVKWQLLDHSGNILSNGAVYNTQVNVGKPIDFLAGKKHTFTLNFLGDVCTIKSQTTDWETPDNEDNDVEFEFEFEFEFE